MSSGQYSGCDEKKDNAYICGASSCWMSLSRCKNTFHIPEVSRRCESDYESLQASISRAES